MQKGFSWYAVTRPGFGGTGFSTAAPQRYFLTAAWDKRGQLPYAYQGMYVGAKNSDNPRGDTVVCGV